MKFRRHALFAIAVFSSTASALWAETPSYFPEPGPTPTPGFHVGFENLSGGTAIAPIKSLRLGYSEYPDTIANVTRSAASFDLLHPNGGVWEWNWISNGATPITAMELTYTGVATFWAPSTGVGSAAYRTWMEIDPATSKITFGKTMASTPTAPTALGTLSLNSGATALLFNSSPILTETTGDARYLRTGVQRLQFGTGSSALSDYSVAFGKGAVADGLGATAIGAAFAEIGRAWPIQAVGKGATAMGYGSVAVAEGATAMGWGSEAHARAGVALGYQNLVDPVSEEGLAIGYENEVYALRGWGSGRRTWSEGRWVRQSVWAMASP